MRPGLLAGLRILEAGESVAIAACGKLLADLGADVITVERPGGSRLRRLPPYYQDVPGPGRSALHAWLSANKRSVTLNLEKPEGRAILEELVRGVGGLLRGAGADEAMDARRLREANPTLTVTSITPFGAGGPYASYRANDLTLFAMSGFSYYLSSPADDPANTPPKQVPGYQVGLAAGLFAASATLWGLAAAKRRGEGVTVDVSEWEAFTYLLYEHIAFLSEGKLAADRQRVPGAAITVVGGLVWCLPCADGWVLVSPREDHQFKQWAEVMGEEEWARTPEFSTAALREQHAWAIYERSAAWTKLRQKADIFQAAQAKKVACFPVSLMMDLPEMAQLKHRGFWVDSDHPIMKGLKFPGLPAKFENVEMLPSGPVPQPGEHTGEIFKELGIGAAELKTLWQLEVI